MVLDMKDELNDNKDIEFIMSDKFRAQNLLIKKYEENPAIGLDISAMVNAGLDTSMIEMCIVKYLGSFGVYPNGLKIIHNKVKGILSFDFDFEEGANV